MNIHTKKNIIFSIYILYNAFLIYILFVLRYGFIYTSVFLFASHLRDFFCVIYHLIHIGRITDKKPALKEGVEQTICCLIPVYAEKVDLVVNNIKSLCNQDLPESTKLFILIICDGLVIGRHNKRPLFNELDDLMTYEDETMHQEKYTSWKTLTENSLNYKIGEMYGKPIILAHKEKNCGKKDSLIVGEQLIEKVDTMEDFKTKYKK